MNGTLLRYELAGEAVNFVFHEDFTTKNFLKKISKRVSVQLPIKSYALSCGAITKDSTVLDKSVSDVLFKRMNYFKWRACCNAQKLNKAKFYLNKANKIKKELVECNMRLAVRFALKVANSTSLSTEDLISEAYFSIIKAVDMFDVHQGFCFSTYATRTIFRDIFKKTRRIGAYSTEIVSLSTMQEPILDYRTTTNDAEIYAVNEERKTYISKILSILSDKEKELIVQRYGLDKKGIRSLEIIGNERGVVKEAIRQGQNKALAKIKNYIEKNNLVETGLNLI